MVRFWRLQCEVDGPSLRRGCMLSVFGVAAALDPHSALLQSGPAVLCKTRSRGWASPGCNPTTVHGEGAPSHGRPQIEKTRPPQGIEDIDF